MMMVMMMMTADNAATFGFVKQSIFWRSLEVRPRAPKCLQKLVSLLVFDH